MRIKADLARIEPRRRESSRVGTNPRKKKKKHRRGTDMRVTTSDAASRVGRGCGTLPVVFVLSSLLAWGWKFIPFNVKNLEGNTASAWDILQEQTEVDNKELRDMLHCAGALSSSSLPTVTSYAHYLR